MDSVLHYEPKRINRFIVEFPEIFDVSYYAVSKADKPKFINQSWSNIKIEFFDFIAPSTSQRLQDIILFLKQDVKSEEEGLFTIKLKTTDPVGEVIELWDVYVDEVVEINFGALDYSNDEMQKPYIIIKPKNCVLRY